MEFLSPPAEFGWAYVFEQKAGREENSVMSGRSHERPCSCCLILLGCLLLGKPLPCKNSNLPYTVPERPHVDPQVMTPAGLQLTASINVGSLSEALWALNLAEPIQYHSHRNQFIANTWETNNLRMNNQQWASWISEISKSWAK